MSGAGNDFVVLGPDEVASLGEELASWARRICRRGLSVGADGVLAVEPAAPGRVRVRFFNPDGGQAFCGNGSRCAARFSRLRGLVDRDSFVLETAAGEVRADVTGARVRLELPPPRDGGELSVDPGDGALQGRRVYAGVPHFVVFVDDVGRAPLERWGPALRRHEAFGPEGTNVDVAVRRGEVLELRTWERGVEAETLSCGSGAVAAAFAARLEGAGEALTIVPRSGVALAVGLPGRARAPRCATLEGDARLVFEGELASEATHGFTA